MTSLQHTSKGVIESVMAAFTSQDQRNYIKIEVQRKKRSAIKIFEAFREACGTSALSYRTVTRWVNEFMSGRETVKDHNRPGINSKCNH